MSSYIYTNTILKYPLTYKEYEHIDNVWKFISYFNNSYITLSEYRKYIIKKIRKKYDIDTFYLYESILNKLIWNLKYLISPFFKNSKNMNNILNYTDLHNLNYNINKILKNQLYYRSFVNKLIIINDINNQIIINPIHNSSLIFNNNNLNEIISFVIQNRKIYESIILNPSLINNKNIIQIPEFYFQFDYGLPNINYSIYHFGSIEYRKKRINKMYFSTNPEKYWYKIIKP